MDVCRAVTQVSLFSPSADCPTFTLRRGVSLLLMVRTVTTSSNQAGNAQISPCIKGNIHSEKKMGHRETIGGRRTKNFFSSPSSHVWSLIIVRRLSSLWVEASCLFFEEYSGCQEYVAARGRSRLYFCSVTCCHIRWGRKINWQLNDTPCEDDKRHLVAQEEAG